MRKLFFKKQVLKKIVFTFMTTIVTLTGFNAHAMCQVTESAKGEKVAYFEKAPKEKASRPYRMKGAVYHPLATSDGYSDTGVASWYGRPFHGRKTASGEIYNMFDYTAAHPTLPIPSCVKVTNLDNGKSVVVRINDRGPYKSDLGTDTSDRIIDLSLKAAMQLGFHKDGLANVELEALPVVTVH